MKKSLSFFLCVLCAACVLAGCSGGAKPIALTLNFSGTVAIDNGQSANITVTGAGAKGVMWSLASVGALSNQTITSVTYTAPAAPLTGTDHLTATSLDDSTKTAVLTINVTSSPSITTTSPMANGVVGTAYNQTVTASGGAGTLTFTVSAGSLPTGLTMSSSGAITGTPSAVGTFNFTVKVTDSSIANTGTNSGPESATQALSITVNQAPAITSANSTTFTVGTAGTFTVTTTGTPKPSLTETGALPTGVSFKDNGDGTGTLSGTPAAGTAANYAITFTAHNGIGTDATQSFTLTVGQPPAITSANSTTFTVGTAGTFTVTATGFPAPTFSETGALPTGVTLNTTSGVLSGTPTAGTGGTYPITMKAHNGIGTDATQSFTLTVNETPAITSANKTTFTQGTAGTFTVTTSGFPVPSIAESGALPTGVTFVDNHNGTGTLAGIPATGTAGNYPITFTPSNGVGSPAAQSFTLTVGQPPAITSGTSTTFTVGTSGTFTVTATGFPAPTFSETGTLPTGVTFNTTTGVLSGTPAAGTGKTYSIMFTATNSVGSSAPQSFTLTVDEAPVITSANNATFSVGAAGTFTVTTTGFPTASLTESGTLPSGVTFVDNGNGTGKLSGTPGAAGTFPITFTATNGVGSPASQSFTLTVNTAPVITSANNTTFTVGTSGTFTVTATGTPSPTLSETGALPTGVTFNPGTGVLSGTPAAGTGKTYPITFTASNGVGTNATQNFTLTVDEAPAITSPTSTTFTEGASGSFTVMTTGFPKPALSDVSTPPLPSGVTFKDNGDGTGTLSGTPASGTAGTYTITFTANNGVGTPATQTFTLTVNSAPVFTSGTSTTFTVGTPGTFTVTATGTPTPTLSETGALPTGVTFNTTTGVLSGTPGAGTGGTYPITFKATSSSGTTQQSFTLTVHQAPAITSATSTTFTVGTNGTFTVTTSGFPKPTLMETGALPTGVTFKDNGDGTGTLSGTPTSATGSPFSIIFTASNGVGTAATQTFTLTVSVNNNALLTGDFAFQFTGFIDAGGEVAIVGRFHADGNGNLTAGALDINSPSSTPAHSTFTGTYTVTGDRRCTLVAGTITFKCVLFSTASGSQVGRIIRFDDSSGTGTRGSGELHAQDLTAATFTMFNGDFAMGFVGDITVNTPSGPADGRLGVVGRVTVGTNGVFSAGTVDVSIPGTSFSSTLPGSLNAPDSASGHGTGSFTVTTPIGPALIHFAYYIVGKHRAFSVTTDTRGLNVPLLSGFIEAQRQTSFTAASITGPVVFAVAGTCGSPDTTTAPASVSIGQAVANGAGMLTSGMFDQNECGAINPMIPLTGTYTADSTGVKGRFTVTLIINPTNAKPEMLYLFDINKGFLLEGTATTPGSEVTFGIINPQTAPTGGFTEANLAGTYAASTVLPATSPVPNMSGEATLTNSVTPPSTLSGTMDVSLPPPGTTLLFHDAAISSGTYALTDSTVGRFTATFTVAGVTFNFVIYQAAPGGFAAVEVTAGNAGSAAMFFQQ